MSRGLSRAQIARRQKREAALARLTPGTMSAFHEGVLRAGDDAVTAVSVPPNPHLRLFDASLKEPELNRAIKEAIAALGGKRGDDLYALIVWSMCVAGQVGDPAREDWRVGVSVAPTLAAAADPQHVRLIPGHMLSAFTPKKFRSAKALAALLKAGTEGGRTVPGALQLSSPPGVAPATTFPWIEVDPRFPVDQWVKTLGLDADKNTKKKKKTTTGPADPDDDNDDGEEDEEEAQEVETERAVPTAASAVVRGVAPADAPVPPTALDARAQRSVTAGVAAGLFVETPLTELVAADERVPAFVHRFGVLPRTFAVDMERLDSVARAIDTGAAFDPRVIVDSLCASLHGPELAAVVQDRVQREASLTLSTATVHVVNAQLSGDKREARFHLVHGNCELWLAAHTIANLGASLPGFLAKTRHLAALIRGAAKVLPFTQARATAATPRCALTGAAIAVGAPCWTSAVVDRASGRAYALALQFEVRSADFAVPATATAAANPAPKPKAAPKPRKRPLPDVDMDDAPVGPARPAAASTEAPPKKKRRVEPAASVQAAPARPPPPLPALLTLTQPTRATLPADWGLGDQWQLDVDAVLLAAAKHAFDSARKDAALDGAIGELLAIEPSNSALRQALTPTLVNDAAVPFFVLLDQFIVPPLPVGAAPVALAALAVSAELVGGGGSGAAPTRFRALSFLRSKAPKMAAAAPHERLVGGGPYAPAMLAAIRVLFGALVCV